MQTKHSHLRLAFASLATAWLVACGSGGIFDRDRDDGVDVADFRGEILDVDEVARRITLDTESAFASNLRPREAERTVYWDDRTIVEYQGESYRPESLERGDEVRVELARDEGRDVADRITVLRDVRVGGIEGDDDFPSLVRGTVDDLDDVDRRIELDREDGGDLLVYWDDRTVVLFDGREYSPTNLERGDEISITGERRGERFLADRITVEYDATPSGGSAGEDESGDLRGTVRSVDTRDRVIELDRTFSGDERILYDERTIVELDGRELRPESLRSGDEIAVSGTRRDDGFLADEIVVVREARASFRP